MAIDAENVKGRLTALDEYLRFLAVMAALDVKTFSADPRNYAAAERFMQLAAETVFDIGSHCLAGRVLGQESADLRIALLAQEQRQNHHG